MKRLWGLSCALFLTGCGCPGQGQDDGGETLSDGGGIDFASFCLSYMTAYCERFIACNRLDLSSRNDCVNNYKARYCDPGTRGATKGYSVFNAQSATECLKEARALAGNCDEPMAFLNTRSCADITRPAAGAGQPCAWSADCVDPKTACSGTSCPRTCSTAGGLGQPCIRGPWCNQGYWCDLTTMTCRSPQPVGSVCDRDSDYNPRCVASSYCNVDAGSCKALPGDGGTCRDYYYPKCAQSFWCDSTATPDTCKPVVAVDQQCTVNDADKCGPANFCDFALTPTSCQKRRAAGASCTWSSQCQQDLTCRSGLCATRVGQGQSCASYGNCLDNLSCDRVLKTCQAYTSVDIGQTCTDSTLSCRDFTDVVATCKGVIEDADGGVGQAGTCGLAATGDPCSWGDDCPRQNSCDRPDGGARGACRVSALGSSCEDTRDCQTAHYCDSAAPRKCAARKSQGQSCSDDSDSECATPLECKQDPDGGGLCDVLGGRDAPCVEGGDNQCMRLLDCIGSRCAVTGHPGERCTRGACFSGGCVRPLDDGPGTCGAYFGTSQPCRSHLDCASNLCEGVCQPTCP